MVGAVEVETAPPGPLAVLAGGGDFPAAVARAAVAEGRGVIVAAIRGEADASIEAHPHRWVGRGQLGTVLRLFREAGARDLVIVGGMRERRLPRLDELDLGAIFVFLRNLRILTRGDDSLLRRIARIFETRGFRIVGAGEVAPELLMPSGMLGAIGPDSEALADVALGIAAAREHGARDLGQAVIVVDGRVVAREGREGTDAMLAAHAARRNPGAEPCGVLIKLPKPMQDLRLDMPAIGPVTVASAAAAGLAGMAVAAGATLVADREGVARAADGAGLWVWGFDDAAGRAGV
ncbi:MAG: UDP-2,3-diacylglucosamine diphosphatase LpxI [Siculibacillus sp.]|nr:UDP-2,3-diacylglucosamine diphosphatase LpxI [Siculibacillus sp.]